MSTLLNSDPGEAPTGAPIVIFGAGGMGRELLLLLRQINETRPTWDVRGFYDDQAPTTPTIAGLPYLGTGADLNATAEPLAVAMAVGSPAARAAVVGRLTSPQLIFPTLVHPGVALRDYQRITLGAGSVIQQDVKLMTDLTIGRFVFVNVGSIVGHDAALGDFCSLMAHVDIGGGTHLETGVYLGTKATALPGVRLGAYCTLGAGAVAVRDIPAHCTAVGVPAKVINKPQ